MKLLTINHSLGNKVIKLETSRTDREMRHPEIYFLLRQTISGSLLCNKHSFVGGKQLQNQFVVINLKKDAKTYIPGALLSSSLEAFCWCEFLLNSSFDVAKKLIAKLFLSQKLECMAVQRCPINNSIVSTQSFFCGHFKAINSHFYFHIISFLISLDNARFSTFFSPSSSRFYFLIEVLTC